MFRRRKNPIGIGPRFVPGRAGGRALRGRMGAISSFQGCVLRPLESIVETICPTRIRKVQPGEKVAPQPPAENIHERLGAICGGGMPAATPQDARHLLLLVRRILHEAREREIDTQEVRRLNEVAGRMRQRFLARRGAVNSRTAASGNDKILQMTVGELVRGARDVTIQIMDRPKGSGIKIERYAMAAGGPGDPHDNRRGPNLGGLTIRNGFANNLYYVHPDRETIEFRPYVGEKGKKYRISIGQREAWKIVNRLTGKLKPGSRDDWYTDFTGRDANVLRSASPEFLKDCVERERCRPEERKGNRKWSDRARLRSEPKPDRKQRLICQT